MVYLCKTNDGQNYISGTTYFYIPFYVFVECFNNWIKKYKCLLIVDLLDKIRRMLMIKFRKRRRVGYSMAGIILPSIMSHLNEKSRNLHYDVESSSNTIAEVSGKDISGHFRHIVDLAAWTCTCRRWQVTGLPCFHAIAFITSLPNNKIADFVHPYYTVEKFKLSYAGVIPPLTDQAHWPKVNLGFRLHPPILRRTAGRPKIQRYKGSHEGVKRGHHQNALYAKVQVIVGEHAKEANLM
jgi:hypothetical protein